MEEQISNNPYTWAYTILTAALKPDDINEGITNSLHYAKLLFNADDVIIYKFENGEYIHIYNQPFMNHNSILITNILNNNKDIIEKNMYYTINIDFDNLNNLLFVPFKTNKAKYIVALTCVKQLQRVNNIYISIFIETVNIIIKELEKRMELICAAEVDALTGLGNRILYEKIIAKKIIYNGMIYGLLDLFRLKAINDNYSHEYGDRYIKETAEVLKRYFPKFNYNSDANGKMTKIETGTCIYRIGGDEFALISDNETYQDVLIKMLSIQNEIKNLDLNVDEPLNINYGITERTKNETFHDLYLSSDKLLSENKREMYHSLGLERRK